LSDSNASAKGVVRIAVHGTGRMGRAIADAAATQTDVELAALVGPQEPDWDTPVPWYGRLEDLPAGPDLLIDFTLPAGTLAAAHWCAARRVALLSGVTGLSPEIRQALSATAAEVAVLWSPNLSLGVNLLADLAGRAAAVLDPGTPVWIEDIHHQWKKDAPSGTALMLGARIAAERAVGAGAVEYSSRREGEVIGEHTVRFQMAGETIELTHRAEDRSIYALGALTAGRWLLRQPPALYTARDWLSSQ
jgi:4-hydroxy-tetrahydrodipicolinate reductase